MKIVVHTHAKAESRKLRRWYDKRQPGLGLDLLDEVRTALTRIDRDPAIGPRLPGTPFRFHRTRRFRFVIYHLELVDHICHICVMAIAHERRRPGYWRRRKLE